MCTPASGPSSSEHVRVANTPATMSLSQRSVVTITLMRCCDHCLMHHQDITSSGPFPDKAATARRKKLLYTPCRPPSRATPSTMQSHSPTNGPALYAASPQLSKSGPPHPNSHGQRWTNNARDHSICHGPRLPQKERKNQWQSQAKCRAPLSIMRLLCPLTMPFF